MVVRCSVRQRHAARLCAAAFALGAFLVVTLVVALASAGPAAAAAWAADPAAVAAGPRAGLASRAGPGRLDPDPACAAPWTEPCLCLRARPDPAGPDLLTLTLRLAALALRARFLGLRLAFAAVLLRRHLRAALALLRHLALRAALAWHALRGGEYRPDQQRGCCRRDRQVAFHSNVPPEGLSRAADHRLNMQRPSRVTGSCRMQASCVEIPVGT